MQFYCNSVYILCYHYLLTQSYHKNKEHPLLKMHPNISYRNIVQRLISISSWPPQSDLIWWLFNGLKFNIMFSFFEANQLTVNFFKQTNHNPSWLIINTSVRQLQIYQPQILIYTKKLNWHVETRGIQHFKTLLLLCNDLFFLKGKIWFGKNINQRTL